jgi:hypothetical protein
MNAKQAEYLEDILSSGEHLLSLINDILDLSKIEAGRLELEPSDFDLPVAAGSGSGARSTSTSANPRRRAQGQAVLLNLLSNALKFTPEGGRIEVRAVAREGMSEIAVADTGVGIAPEDQEAVFEEFSPGGAGGQEGGRDRPRAGPVQEIRGGAWGPDLGREPGGRGLDLHVHAARTLRAVSSTVVAQPMGGQIGELAAQKSLKPGSPSAGSETSCVKGGAAAWPPHLLSPAYCRQILKITPVPGIWTSGPFTGGPTKCVSLPRSRTAP